MAAKQKYAVRVLLLILFSVGFCMVQDLNYYFTYRDDSNQRFAYSTLVSENIYSDLDDIEALNERSFFSDTSPQDLLRLETRYGETALLVGEAGVNRIYNLCVYLCFTGFFLFLLLPKQKAWSLLWLLPWLLALTAFSGTVFRVYSISFLYLGVALFFFSACVLQSGTGGKHADLLKIPGAILTVGFAFFMIGYFLIKKPDLTNFFKDKLVGDYVLLPIVAGVHAVCLIRAVKRGREAKTDDASRKKAMQSLAVQYGVAIALTLEILIYLALNGYSYFARVFVNLFAIGYFVLLRQAPEIRPFEAFAERILGEKKRESAPCEKTKRKKA